MRTHGQVSAHYAVNSIHPVNSQGKLEFGFFLKLHNIAGFFTFIVDFFHVLHQMSMIIKFMRSWVSVCISSNTNNERIFVLFRVFFFYVYLYQSFQVHTPTKDFIRKLIMNTPQGRYKNSTNKKPYLFHDLFYMGIRFYIRRIIRFLKKYLNDSMLFMLRNVLHATGSDQHLGLKRSRSSGKR